MSDLDVLFTGDGTKVEELEFKGKKVQVKLREISWSEKNKILNKCFIYQSSGEINFNFDQYNKEMLKKLVVSISVEGSVVPEINEIFFARLNSSFGSVLEKLIPKAFEELNASDFFVKKQDS